MMKNYLYLKIDKLKLPVGVINRLKKKQILIIDDIWKLKRIDLKNMDFQNEEINLIIIQLQLLGLDLNKKMY